MAPAVPRFTAPTFAAPSTTVPSTSGAARTTTPDVTTTTPTGSPHGSPHGGEAAAFGACPATRIPAPTAAELRVVFGDIDADGRGYITPGELVAALAVNDIPLTAAQLGGLLATLAATKAARTAAAARARGVPAWGDEAAGEVPGAIREADYLAALYALSVQHREVQPAGTYAVFPDSDFSTETASDWFKLKRRIWAIVDEPSSSRAALAFAWTMAAVILISVTAFIVDSAPDTHAEHGHGLHTVEVLTVVWFTAEYAARWVCTPEPRRYLWSFFHWVDLLSIAPFYLELLFAGVAGSGAPLLRALRLVRILRLIKIGRYVAWVRIFGRTLETSMRPLGMLGFVTAMAIISWSSVEYFVERGNWDDASGTWLRDDGEPSFFPSIPASFWWAVVSMTTTGYGDTYPSTLLGRLIAVAAILMGIMLLAIPISVVTGNLHAEYNRMDRLRRLRMEHELQAAMAPTAAAPPPPPLPPPPAPGATSVPMSRAVSLGGDDGAIAAPRSGSYTSMGSSGSVTAPSGAPAATAPVPVPPKLPQLMRAYSDFTLGGMHTHGEPPASLSSTASSAAMMPPPPINKPPHYAAAAAMFPLPSTPSAMPSLLPRTPSMAHLFDDGGGIQMPATASSAALHTAVAATAAGRATLPYARSSLQSRVDAAWSEPFLRSVLLVVRGNRRRLMSSLKAAELRNREHGVEDIKDFVTDMSNPDRGKVLLRTAMSSGLI